MAFNDQISTVTPLEGGGGYVNQLKYNSEELRNMAMFLRNSSAVEKFNKVKAIANINVLNSWQGPDAEAFASKIDELITKIASLTNNWYMEMANNLDRAAEEYENTTHNIINEINKF